MTAIELIALPTPFSIGDVNVYLIETEPLTLVDTGPLYQPAYDALEAALAARGRGVEDIGLVLLTHQHFDHIGLAATFQRKGARVAALGPLADRLAALEGSMRAEDRFAIAVMRSVGVPEDAIEQNAAVSAKHWRYAETVEDVERLADGELLTVGDRRLRVQHRPGHSPTDTLFVDEDAGEAIVGDHLLLSISSNPVAHRPASGSEDPADREPALIHYLESLARTRELDLHLVLPGHRKPIADHRALVDKRVALHEERADRIYELVRAGNGRVMEVAEHLWPRVPANETYLAVSEILGHIDILVRDGRIAASAPDGITVFTAV